MTAAGICSKSSFARDGFISTTLFRMPHTRRFEVLNRSVSTLTVRFEHGTPVAKSSRSALFGSLRQHMACKITPSGGFSHAATIADCATTDVRRRNASRLGRRSGASRVRTDEQTTKARCWDRPRVTWRGVNCSGSTTAAQKAVTSGASYVCGRDELIFVPAQRRADSRLECPQPAF